MDKPSYILNFQKPKNTEIKHINGHWYLYERYSVYDPVIKRSRKKSGKIIGRITENGLIPSREKTEHKSSICNDIVEVGAVNIFYGRTTEMRERLKHYFPDLWQQIYIIAIVRAIYDCRFKRVQLHYEDSALSYVYPGVSFSARSVSTLLSTLGRPVYYKQFIGSTPDVSAFSVF